MYAVAMLLPCGHYALAVLLLCGCYVVVLRCCCCAVAMRLLVAKLTYTVVKTKPSSSLT